MKIDNRPIPFYYQFLSGAIAGITEVSINYPLDVVKTRLQLQIGSKATAALNNTPHYNGVFDCLSKILKHEGIRRLYRGISAPILMEAPKRAVKFGGNERWGIFYRNLFKVDEMSQALSILTGASAGLTEACVIVPFEYCKIQLQDKTKHSQYTNILDVVKKTIKNHGILRLYTGLEATMWKHSSWNAAYFGSVFQIRALLPKPKNSTEKTINDLIAGGVGGIMGTTVSTPFDVVKSRVQSQPHTPGLPLKYIWNWQSVILIHKQEGFNALFKGYAPKLLRYAPGGGILLVVFSECMDFFRKFHYSDQDNDQKLVNKFT
ncbi:mitochondrial carrier [Ascoidea rubescens DSM 1968]|uniref:Mitochondrial carrier n=1 Tax=Ascoidea rubescens DSM 1968 TaxID=1344418 RepID=A0A1D2VLN7_9ASCO|nr:mitochondrial carrier [Ascoidea rubescens DSM 1968]ODV62494.1 mitochondrial carrier [Ascoidea rubescens DSM 1968]